MYMQHTYNNTRILFNLKEGNPASATKGINLKDIMLSEISQSWKDKCYIILFIEVCKIVQLRNRKENHDCQRLRVEKR